VGVPAELATRGFAVVPGMLAPAECRKLRAMYDDRRRFRTCVQMERHGFGRGEYRYFAYPLPRLVASLRATWYRRLAAIANGWNESLRVPTRFPTEHAAFLDECRARGQTRPTPLLLRYHADDYNCLHQDVYGEAVFPLQITCLLSAPDREFAGGELVLTEQRPRMQSRVEVVPLSQGDGVVFAVRHRPATGARGTYRVNMRHGVSRILSGERFALGIIFHDAP
jgi:hypothetical protein